MTWNVGIQGYAAQWDVVTQPLRCPLTGTARSPVYFGRNCFVYDPGEVGIWFMHRPLQSYGEGAALDLEIWEDGYGLAFSFKPPQSAYSLVRGIQDGRYSECSVSFSYKSQSAGAVDIVDWARVREISIVPRGACPGTQCWTSHTPLNRLPPAAAALAPRWHAGRLEALLAESDRIVRAGRS